MKTLIAFALLAAALPAAADFRYTGSKLQVYAPQAGWAITLPREDWVVEREQVKPDGSLVYFMASSRKREMAMSVFIDRTAACNSGPTCRANWLKNPGPLYAGALEPVEVERNGFSVIHYYLDKPQGIQVVQANASGHAYRDGSWIDVRVSKVGAKRPDNNLLLAAIDTVTIAPRVPDGARQYPAEDGRFVEFDVPKDWRDTLGQGPPPAYVLKPASGNGFEVLVSLIVPRSAGEKPPTREEMLDQAKHAVKAIQDTAVESNIAPKEVRGKNAWGYTFAATDKDPGGGYKHLRQGLLALGNVQIFFTILSREGEEKTAAQALEAMLGARAAP